MTPAGTARCARRAPAAALGIAVALSLASIGSAAAAESPTRVSFVGAAEEEAGEGHVVLGWEPAAGADRYELQQSPEPGFADPLVRYEGEQLSFFATGLEEGNQYFRVRALHDGGPAGAWSAVKTVHVDYPGRAKVGWLLVIGTVVFLATVITIVAGSFGTGPRAARSRNAG